MSRQYTKVEVLSEEVFRGKAAGETNREVGARFGLSKEQGHLQRQHGQCHEQWQVRHQDRSERQQLYAQLSGGFVKTR